MVEESGKVVFDRSKTSTQNDEQEDVWDDRALIRAYERSLKQVRNKISSVSAARTSTSSTSIPSSKQEYRDNEEALQSEEEEETDDGEVEDDEEEYTHQAAPPAIALKKKSNPNEWSVGDLCMAVYTQDGLAYPANVINIDGDKCTVRYVHYLNEEDKLLDELFEECDKKVKKRGQEERSRLEATTKPRMSEFVPPPMPVPFLPGLGVNEAVSDDDTLHSMLISWYMSGYHTGYYYGLKKANAQKKTKF